jgi:phage gpG-like protein
MSDLADLQKLLDRAAKEIPDKALRIIGVEGKNFIAKNFNDQGFTDASSNAWKPRKTVDKRGNDLTRYKTSRRGKAGELNQYGRRNIDRAILVGFNTGGNKLKNSFKYRISLGSQTVVFYTAKEYAARHNEGLDGMPKRQFIGKSAYFEEQISKKLVRELDKIFK